MTLIDVFEGARLASWGIGMVLVVTALRRALGEARHWLAREGLAAAPPPLPQLRELHTVMVLSAALATGLIPLVIFTSPIFARMIVWLYGLGSPVAAIVALHALILVEVYFLARIAWHPGFKLRWSAGWYLFSMAVGVLW